MNTKKVPSPMLVNVSSGDFSMDEKDLIEFDYVIDDELKHFKFESKQEFVNYFIDKNLSLDNINKSMANLERAWINAYVISIYNKYRTQLNSISTNDNGFVNYNEIPVYKFMSSNCEEIYAIGNKEDLTLVCKFPENYKYNPLSFDHFNLILKANGSKFMSKVLIKVRNILRKYHNLVMSINNLTNEIKNENQSIHDHTRNNIPSILSFLILKN